MHVKMRLASTTPIRRAALAGTAAVVGLLSATPAGAVAHAAANPAGHGGGGGCPAAESLVPGTTWHKRTLAPGVVMSVGSKSDSNGVVAMHVLRVDLTAKNVSMTPLVHALAERSPLSSLAAGHPRLVAATNTGYFDFRLGAPTQPFIAAKVPLVISSAHQEVVGLDSAGLMESGKVWWAALLTAGSHTHAVAAKNEVYPPNGITMYTSKWGSASIPAAWNGVAVSVVKGVITAKPQPRHGLSVPSGGYLLVARGQSASKWLSARAVGAKISLASSVVTSAPKPFVQAYGVGVEVVQTAGVVRTGLSCDSLQTKQPARTEIGFADGGRHMIIAIVADHRGTSMHGLDEDQMSKLMVQLGASQAFAFDGSGSTELLARVTAGNPLKLENYPADGQERAMPLGLGILSAPTKTKAKHKH
jgi:hypothetical protein